MHHIVDGHFQEYMEDGQLHAQFPDFSSTIDVTGQPFTYPGDFRSTWKPWTQLQPRPPDTPTSETSSYVIIRAAPDEPLLGDG